MVIAFGIVEVAIAPLRAEPKHASEQVNQLLFGEKCIIFQKEKEDWFYVRNEWDQYDGWIKKGYIKIISEKEYKRKNKFISCALYDCLIAEDESIAMSPGSNLFKLTGRQFKWENPIDYRYKGKKINLEEATFDPKQFIEYCQLFLGTPYLWGGKSITGIDCSGLSQILFKLFNYKLPRDAYQQAKEGQTIHFLMEAEMGDLAFFDNANGHINHVGILLNHDTILHATDTAGKVVIDKIDNGGIISTKLKQRTHNLRLIKRYFN